MPFLLLPLPLDLLALGIVRIHLGRVAVLGLALELALATISSTMSWAISGEMWTMT